MQVMTLWREWGFSVMDGRFYGRRWCLHIGPFLIFVRQCTEAELECWWEERKASAQKLIDGINWDEA